MFAQGLRTLVERLGTGVIDDGGALLGLGFRLGTDLPRLGGDLHARLGGLGSGTTREFKIKGRIAHDHRAVTVTPEH